MTKQKNTITEDKKILTEEMILEKLKIKPIEEIDKSKIVSKGVSITEKALLDYGKEKQEIKEDKSYNKSQKGILRNMILWMKTFSKGE